MNPQDSHSHFCFVAVDIGPKRSAAAARIESWCHVKRPHPGEELNTAGEPTRPRQAATVMVLRHGGAHSERGLEVLMVRRNPEARFMPGLWVFPGGAVETAEGEDDRAHRVCALRELEEEANMKMDDPEALVPVARWVTPAELVTRFDTRFYIGIAPPHCKPRPDDSETVDAGWFAPKEALEAHARGEMGLAFPTIKQLEALAEHATAAEAIAAARDLVVEPVEPRVVIEGEEGRVVLPGEPGYS